jgi:hypothetical protein
VVPRVLGPSRLLKILQDKVRYRASTRGRVAGTFRGPEKKVLADRPDGVGVGCGYLEGLSGSERYGQVLASRLRALLSWIRTRGLQA